MIAALAHERQGSLEVAWGAERAGDRSVHASNSYPATVMPPKASLITYSAGRRAGDRAHPERPTRAADRHVSWRRRRL